MTNSASERPGEFALIAELFAPLADAPGAFGLTDDAAIVTPPAGHDLVATTDALVEGVHFFAGDPADLIAKKALRVSLSDLAAKGCAPAGYLLALSLPARIEMSWLRAFAGGLHDDQRAFGVSLLGGDTTTTPGPVTIAITAFGHVPAGAMLRRTGARPGDIVFVSGTIGDSGGGLVCLKDGGAALQEHHRAFLVGRFQVPQPRIALGHALLGLASASIDVSDGLIADLGHIAETSGVRIDVEAERLPLSAALASVWPDRMDRIVRAATAGDDYEIAFTAPPEHGDAVLGLATSAGVPITQIGLATAGEGAVLLDANRRQIPIDRPGYVHF